MASEEEAMAYSRGAVERAMKVQEVILRAIDGKLTWVQAADILGYSPRTIRRIRWRLQHYGYEGSWTAGGRPPRPSAPRSPRCSACSRSIASGIWGSTSGISTRPAPAWRALLLCVRQEGPADRGPGGQAPAPRPAPAAPRACFGELLHLDGSRHSWLALRPEQWFTLIAVVDDATKRLLYAELREGGESVAAILTALRAVLEHDGVPMALYTDRAHWAVHTPTSGSAPDRQHP